MGILEDLWDGKIAPNERQITPSEEAIRKAIHKKDEKLTPMLSPEAKALFEELMDCQGELASLHDCEIFAEGFSHGRKGNRGGLEITFFNFLTKSLEFSDTMLYNKYTYQIQVGGIVHGYRNFAGKRY